MSSPFVQLPMNNLLPHATILICGAAGVGKQILGKCLVEYKDPNFQVYVYTSTHLNEPDDQKQKGVARFRLDFIILQIDLTNRSSLEHLRKSLNELDPCFFFSRVGVVATKVSEKNSHSIPVKEIEELILSYHELPIIYMDLPTMATIDKQFWVADLPAVPRILNLVKNAVHYRSDGNSYLPLNLSTVLYSPVVHLNNGS